MNRDSRFYKMLAKIGINGRRDILFLAIGYLILLILTALALAYGDLPGSLAIIAACIPLVLFTVLFIAYGIKSSFVFLKRKLSRLQYVLFCIFIFLFWTTILAYCLTLINQWGKIALISLALANAAFLSWLILTNWMDKMENSVKNRKQFLLIHLVLYMPLIITCLAGGRHVITLAKCLPDLAGSFILLFIGQILIYYMLSIVLLLAVLINLPFAGKRIKQAKDK